MIKLKDILKEIKIETQWLELTPKGREFINSRTGEEEDYGDFDEDDNIWLLKQVGFSNKNDKVPISNIKEKLKELSFGDNYQAHLWLTDFKNMLRNEILKDLNSGLKEISSAKTPVTMPGEEDPAKLATSWDVTYEPNFVALVEDTKKLIKDYETIIKKNHFPDTHPYNKNLAKLKDFRIDLEYIIQALHPDVAKKFKNKL